MVVTCCRCSKTADYIGFHDWMLIHVSILHIYIIYVYIYIIQNYMYPCIVSSLKNQTYLIRWELEGPGCHPFSSQAGKPELAVKAG